MRFVPPNRYPQALAAFGVAGVLIALGATPLQSWSSNHLGRPGYGIAVAVNVLLPLGTLLVSLWHPRILIAALGGPLLVFCFVFVRLLIIEPRFWSWSVPFIVNR